MQAYLIQRLLLVLGLFNFAVGTVEVSTKKETVTRGKTVFVTCKTSAGELFKEWRFGDKVLAAGTNDEKYEVEKVSTTESKLTFKKVQESMGGPYSCLGDKGQTDDVVLGIEFEFLNVNLNQGIIKGTNDLVECVVSGYPRPTVTWTKNGATLPSNSVKYALQASGSMLIKNVNDGDEGDYKCKVTQGSQLDDRVIKVAVYYRAQIDPAKSTLFAYSYTGYGGTIDLICVATGKPVPTVVITFNGNQVYGEAGGLVSQPGLYSVKIRTTEIGTFGKYVCNASSTINSDTKDIILDQAVSPKIERTSKDIVGNLGGDTKLECSVSGKPKPEIEWFVLHKTTGMKKPLVGSRYIKKDGSLTISKTTKEDIGKYVCQATNIRGTVKGNAEIISVEEVVAGKRSGGGRVLQSFSLLVFALMTTVSAVMS